MDACVASLVRKALLDAWINTSNTRRRGTYALALIADNAATIWDLPCYEEGLRRVATKYDGRGYRYQAGLEELTTLRSWRHGFDGPTRMTDWHTAISGSTAKSKRASTTRDKERSEGRERIRRILHRVLVPSRKIARGNPGLVGALASPTAKITEISSHRDSGQPIPFHPKNCGENISKPRTLAPSESQVKPADFGET